MGWSEFEVIPQRTKAVLAHTMASAEGRMVAVHNFSSEPVSTTFTVPDASAGTVLVDLLDDDRTESLDENGSVSLSLEAYGYRWLRVLNPGEKRLG
jgi:hypothetical protein